MSFTNQSSIEMELENTILNKTGLRKRMIQRVQFLWANGKGFRDYRNLFDSVMQNIVNPVSREYGDHPHHSFRLFYRLLVAQTLAMKIRHHKKIYP